MAEGAKHPEELGLLYDVLSISSAGRLELTIPDRGCSGCFASSSCFASCCSARRKFFSLSSTYLAI